MVSIQLVIILAICCIAGVAEAKQCRHYPDCPGCGFYERCCFREGPPDNGGGWTYHGECKCGENEWEKKGWCN
ncbi:hypothetical protein BV898_07127 [Hypsibius exemplaris]|uniref:Uncharacterized protein n=1 Tax=Hypsibius exemplaris TaxID=2072580 RepID=A0A1W0WUJ8_HYPEX|nr:hypothetical protein BV898_07127 [Hypsibius exemplaris]